jgi:hypothetical protein
MRTALFVGVLLAVAAAAPAPDVAGTWTVTMDGDTRRSPDRAPKQIEGTLVLTQKGTDLTGTWSTIDHWKVTGRIDDAGRIELTSERRAVPFSKDGKTGTVEGRWTFRGTLKDGRLAGTAALEIGDSQPVPRPWSAKRK